MIGSAVRKRRFGGPQGLVTAPLVVAYLALSAFSARASIDAVSHVLEPIERASSDSPTEPVSAVSLGGAHLP